MPDDSCVPQPADISGSWSKLVPARTGFSVKSFLKFIGPAFIVSVAYIDPGNFATNISGGSRFNYSLLWVILWSNLMAIFLQTLSAKLGIATGQNLPRLCGFAFSRRVNWLLWGLAEMAAMATDLAEFLGGTLGLYLLFHIPLLAAGLITAALTLLIVLLGRYGQRVVEIVISLLVAIICGAYAFEMFLAKPDWSSAAFRMLIPSLPGKEAIYIAVGMLGATVMPHVIYLHSQLVQCRNGAHTIEEKKRHFRMERIDIIVAMNVAFIVNSAMLLVSASVFFRNGMVVETIEQAHRSLTPLLGSLSAGAFGLALIASGLSSAAVGTMAGQTIMQGFIGLKISDNVTRLVTMAPGLLIILSGINPMKALVFSQVSLSFVLPAAVIPLILLTSRKDIMGQFANKKPTVVVGWIIVALITLLNALLVIFTLRPQ